MIFTDSGLKDKVVLITGGSRGIGKAMVELFAKEGADVSFFYNKNKELAENIEKSHQDEGRNVKAFQVDVRDKASCESVVESIVDRAGSIDVLINNSGIMRDNLLVGLEADDIEAVMRTNILGVFNVTQSVVPFMMSQRSGKIISMSSVAAVRGGRGQANYAASKGAVNALTRSLAVELAPRNIKVNAIAPGVIDTDMTKEFRDMAGDDTILSKILLKRFGQPEEVAYAALFLASKYADYITGMILPVDGGCRME